MYQIDLRKPGVSLPDLADLVIWLPAGCALWLAMGGPASLSPESEQLRTLDYRLRILSWQQTKDGSDGRNQPKPPERVKWAHERAAEAMAVDEKSSAWARRQALRAGSTPT